MLKDVEQNFEGQYPTTLYNTVYLGISLASSREVKEKIAGSCMLHLLEKTCNIYIYIYVTSFTVQK